MYHVSPQPELWKVQGEDADAFAALCLTACSVMASVMATVGSSRGGFSVVGPSAAEGGSSVAGAGGSVCCSTGGVAAVGSEVGSDAGSVAASGVSGASVSGVVASSVGMFVGSAPVGGSAPASDSAAKAEGRQANRIAPHRSRANSRFAFVYNADSFQRGGQRRSGLHG